ncbi:MAG TPA: thioesterase family protein [Smithella sp.]|jgi:acyl-CoA thioester hydrolase|nr:thioesterase family protein [Smithella sp.]HOX99337.1 thioesterase family protein [Smithella sp.]HPC08654.1 thioesterase family protein [Smithella sp.]HPH55919.1 thioesterase family protein [Smithella sp.]HPK21421.1 thioesterase family protein [Smithella sp.]
MKPKPFKPEIYHNDERYVRDLTTGLVWHRSVYRVLYIDTDRSQVVYHSNYLRYFEFGRTSLMRDLAYPYKEIEDGGYVYPIFDLGISFHQPLYYDDVMYIHTRPVNLERVRLQFDYLITHQEKGNIICAGFTKHCALNLSGTPVAVDAKTVHLWKTFPV